MKLSLTIDVDEGDIRLLSTHSLQRVLHSLEKARTRGEFLTVQQDIAALVPLASLLWYAATTGRIDKERNNG